MTSKVRSRITDDMTTCFICGKRATEVHHLFGGSNRKASEKYGLVVGLCHACHNEPPNGAHHNAETMLRLKRIGQEAFEREQGHDEFMRIFGKNYL